MAKIFMLTNEYDFVILIMENYKKMCDQIKIFASYIVKNKIMSIKICGYGGFYEKIKNYFNYGNNGEYVSPDRM